MEQLHSRGKHIRCQQRREKNPEIQNASTLYILELYPNALTLSPFSLIPFKTTPKLEFAKNLIIHKQAKKILTLQSNKSKDMPLTSNDDGLNPVMPFSPFVDPPG
jgi:hypothetical protein